MFNPFKRRVQTRKTVRNMTPDEERIFDDVFTHMDAAFREMDKLFEGFRRG